MNDSYVRPRLATVPGVAEVAGVGGFPIEYHVSVDPNRLRAHGTDLNEVVRRVEQSNAGVSGHVLEKGKAEFVVRSSGRLGDGESGPEFDPSRMLRDLERVPVGTDGLTLIDVATVSVGPGPRRRDS